MSRGQYQTLRTADINAPPGEGRRPDPHSIPSIPFPSTLPDFPEQDKNRGTINLIRNPGWRARVRWHSTSSSPKRVAFAAGSLVQGPSRRPRGRSTQWPRISDVVAALRLRFYRHRRQRARPASACCLAMTRSLHSDAFSLPPAAATGVIRRRRPAASGGKRCCGRHDRPQRSIGTRPAVTGAGSSAARAPEMPALARHQLRRGIAAVGGSAPDALGHLAQRRALGYREAVMVAAMRGRAASPARRGRGAGGPSAPRAIDSSTAARRSVAISTCSPVSISGGAARAQDPHGGRARRRSVAVRRRAQTREIMRARLHEAARLLPERARRPGGLTYAGRDHGAHPARAAQAPAPEVGGKRAEARHARDAIAGLRRRQRARLKTRAAARSRQPP